VVDRQRARHDETRAAAHQVTQLAIDARGLEDIQRRITALGARLKPGALERPSTDIAKRLVISNRRRLGRGVDVNGRALNSQLARRLGLMPLGGEHGTFAQSIQARAITGSGSDGVDLYSTFIGAKVAYYGKTITPKRSRYLTIPLEARGGEFSSSASGRFMSAGLSIGDSYTGHRARHYDNTFFMATDGKLFLVQNDKRKKFSADGKRKLRFLFLLVKSVRYPKNEWIGVSSDDTAMAIQVYGDFLDRVAP
jgi:hypothetical protein